MMKKDGIHVSLKVMILAAALGLTLITCIKAPTKDQVKAMFQVVDVTTKWVAKAYTPWPPRLVLVPTLSCRFKNTTDKPLTYIDINAAFKFKGERQNLGENFWAAIDRKAVMPGEKSQEFTFTSPYGYDGRNLASIENHPWWKTKIVEVNLFASTRGSGPVLVGTWTMSHEIDFKEPPPVEPKKAEADKKPKK
jgi:hypothetical protein